MNAQLHSLYTERINGLESFIMSKSEGNDDLAQELRIGMYEALTTDPCANDAFLKRRGAWRMINSLRKGKSIDKPIPYKRKNPVTIVHFDYFSDENDVFTETMSDKRLPVDEEAIFHISLSRFFHTLTGREKRFVRYKVIDELSCREIGKRLRISLTTLREIRKEIRLKFTMVFAD
jgi:DNA-directed RNA polymerase specialized sigma24 family protein